MPATKATTEREEGNGGAPPPAPSTAAAELREVLARASKLANELARSSGERKYPDGSDAEKDLADLALAVGGLAMVAKDITLDLDLDLTNAPEQTKDGHTRAHANSVKMLRAIAKELRPKLRPDRVGGPRGEHAPINRDDLMRDLARCPIVFVWKPQIEGDLAKIHRDGQQAWLAKRGWNEVEPDILVARVREILLREGPRLLGLEAPADLTERIEGAIGSVRRRAADAERDPENYVRAMLRAYGVDEERASQWARSATVKGGGT